VPLSFIALLAACANAPQQQKPEQAQLSKPAREQSAAVEGKQSAQPIHWLSSKATRGGGHASRQPLSWEHEVGSTQPMPTLADSILTRAEELVGTPYRTGGSSLKGFDCSGFVNYVFREEAGIQLPRSTRQIINLDVPVVSKNDLQPGDILLKLDNEPAIDGRQSMNQVARSRPGDKISIEVLRNGKPLKLTGIIGLRPPIDTSTSSGPSPDESAQKNGAP